MKELTVISTVWLLNREICPNGIAVVIYRDLLNAYLNAYLKWYNPNLTKMSTTGVK